ncbi:MAG: hypothetical protein SVU32_03970 [Candidatus Nanohaloarchaea archaeon]|nr:hypothetical protein [Candidatus Nanohaloarchaea archaeon]
MGEEDDTTFVTIGDQLPANFVQQVAEAAGGYRTKNDLDWSEKAETPAAEVQDLVEEWSSKHETKLAQFTAQLNQLLEDIAQEPGAAKEYVDEEL